MADKPFFSARISQSLSDAIEVHRKQTGESKTEVLTKALAGYVGYQIDDRNTPVPPIQKRLDEIFRRLEILENNKITSDNIKQSESKQLEITTDNEMIMGGKNIVSTQEVIKKMSITQGTLSNWKNSGLLPKQKNGYEVDFIPEISSPRKSKWSLITIDN